MVTLELLFNSSSFILPVNYFSMFNSTLNHLILTGDPSSSQKATIDDVNADAFHGLYQLKSLSVQYLKCEMNKLSVMKSGSHHPLLNIEELSFRHIDMIEDIVAGNFFTPLVGLKRIRVEETDVDLRMVNLTSLSSLEQLDLIHLSSNSQLPNDLVKNKPNLKVVRLVGFRNPEMQWNRIFSGGCPQQLKELYLEMGHIENLSLTNCMELEILNLAGNELKSIHLSSLGNLQQLSLSLNRLKTISIYQQTLLPSLCTIDLSHNIRLDVKSITSLISLSPNLVDLNLNHIDFTSELPTLSPVCPSGSLTMNLCDIQSIPSGYFQHCDRLKFLSLDGNEQITYFESSFVGLHSISRIDCMYCNKRSGFTGVYVTKLEESELILSDGEISIQSFADPEQMVSEIANASSYVRTSTEEPLTTAPVTTMSQTENTPDWSLLNFDDDMVIEFDTTTVADTTVVTTTIPETTSPVRTNSSQTTIAFTANETTSANSNSPKEMLTEEQSTTPTTEKQLITTGSTTISSPISDVTTQEADLPLQPEPTGPESGTTFLLVSLN